MAEDVNGDGSVLRYTADEFRAFHKQCIDEERVQYNRETGALVFEIGEDLYGADPIAVRNNQADGPDDVFLRRRSRKA